MGTRQMKGTKQALCERQFRPAVVLLLATCGWSIGCQRAVDPQYVSAAAMSQLEPKLQQAVKQALSKWSGTARDPKLIG